MATDLATVAPETLLLFDRADDDAIVARIRGAALQEYVYSFKQGGQMIYGLGIDGAEACKRELAKVSELLTEDAHALFPKSAEEDERAVLISSIKAIIRDDHIPVERVKKLKLTFLGDQDGDPQKADVAALRALRDHLR